MKVYPLLIIVILITACSENQTENTEAAPDPIANNEELINIHKNDQADRQSDNVDWFEVSKRDSLRRKRVYELLDSALVLTSKDYENAAMVFQHGGDSTSYGMAVKLI